MPKTPRKILLTGAAGFVGSQLLPRILSAGYDAAVILRPSTNRDKIAGVLPQVTCYEADLADFVGVSVAVTEFRPDAVIHLATRYAVSHRPEQAPDFVRDNVISTVNLLEAAVAAGTGLFVNTGTCFVYQPSDQPVAEDAAIAPVNFYAATKRQAEEACAFYGREYPLSPVTLRIFAPYGPGDHDRRLIPYAIRSFLDGEAPRMTTGKQRWDFVYIEDVCDAFLKVLQKTWDPKDTRHEIFNIGTGTAVSVRDIVEGLKEVCGSTLEPQWGAIPHRDNELWHVCADNGRAKRELGWTPQTGLKDSLKHTVQFIRCRQAAGIAGS